MKLLFVISILLFNHLLFAQDTLQSLLSNDREANSFHIDKKENRKLRNLYKEITRDQVANSFKSSIQTSTISNICGLNIVKHLENDFPQTDINLILLSLRDQNLIDDISFDLISKNLAIQEYFPREMTSFRRITKLTEEQKKSILRILSQFSSKLERGSCATNEYKSLYSELKNIVADKKDKKIKNNILRQVFDFGLNAKAINEEIYQTLEALRLAKIHEWQGDLAEYLQKKQQIRIQFPIAPQMSNSQFVTVKAKKMKASLRMRLYQSYDYIQMAMMADIIKKLKRRLDSEKIQINIFNDQVDQEPTEVISLDPMERFRFALKLLQREMHELSINSFFNGRKPTYTDLMVASFELGIVPAEELDEVASLEEIWNPKKTLWDKAQFWVTSVLSIAAIVIPPPYGFIPSLAIVAIQASSQKKEEAEYEHSLF